MRAFHDAGLPALVLALAACQSTPPLPEGTGRGVIAFDPAPPAGAQVWQRPEWRVGDQFTLIRGGQAKRTFTVSEAGPTGYTLADEDGLRMRRDADLGNLGDWPKEGDEALHVLSPVDTRFHWPLWVGKKWRCEFVDAARGGTALPLQVGYEVEDLDTITVAAGTFSALRIVRTSRLMLEGSRFLDRSMIVWYAPEIGLEVRQVIGESFVDLVEWKSGAAAGAK
jgi:hypothetical protein